MSKSKKSSDPESVDTDTIAFVPKFNEDSLRVSALARASYEEFTGPLTDQIFDNMTFELSQPVLVEDKNITVLFKYSFRNIRYANDQKIGHSKRPVHFFPNMARAENANYELLLYVDIVQEMFLDKGSGRLMAYERGNRIYEKRHITNIPLMVMSKYCMLRKIKDKIPLELIGECPYEKGGYFIMNNDITFKFGEEILSNFIFYSKSSLPGSFAHEVSTKSVDPTKYSQMYKVHMVFVDEYNHRKPRSPFTALDEDYIRDRVIEFDVPSVLEKRIPLYILFRAYGILSDFEITAMILGKDMEERPDLVDFLTTSMESADGVRTQEQAIKFIFKLMYPKSITDARKKNYTETEIVNDILLHQILMHTGTDARAKAVYLGLMARKLIRGVLGEIEYDDRDDYAFKRYTGPSRKLSDTLYFLVVNIVQQLQNGIRSEFARTISRKAGSADILDAIADYRFAAFDNITSKPNAKFSIYMSRGKFPIKTRKGTKSRYEEGVTENKSESYNHMERISAIRRANFATSSIRLGGKPNAVHPSQIGFICMYETPDGHNIGTLKHFSMGTMVSTEKGREQEIVSKLVAKLPVILISQVSPRDIGAGTAILHNGIPLAYTKNPYEFDNLMRSVRRKGLLPEFTSCFYSLHDRVYYIWSSTGRLVRPVMTVYRDADGKARLPALEYLKTEMFKRESFDAMVFDTPDRPALFEYIDAHESKNRLIAESVKQVLEHDKLRAERKTHKLYEFCEIHPLFTLGYSAGLMPYLNYMPYPRALYQACPLQKGMMAMPFTNILWRNDKASQMLMYGMDPHVKTVLYEDLHMGKMPAYTELVVAMCNATGFAQEDSVVLNAASVRRGLFTLIYLKRYSQKEDREALGEGAKVFCNPLHLGISVPNPEIYHALDKYGIPRENTLVYDGDVIISMVSMGSSGEKLHPRDTVYHGAPGYIDAVTVIGPYSQPQSIDVRIRTVRKIQVGDKVASRFAQKGTCALILEPEDMPVTESGIVPDMLVNLHAMPSRSTCGHIIEMLAGRMACLYGLEVDATPFTDTPGINEINEKIREFFDIAEYGEEMMIDGMTGYKNRVKTFMGPIAYQRMKQMVEDKFHVREIKGKTVLLTRQPTEGRARDGGKRVGEMERDVLIAHGLSAFTNELLMKNSDEFTAYVCKTCGYLGTFNGQTGVSHCGICQDRADVRAVRMPYAFKLMLQETMSAGLGIRLVLD